MKTYIMFGVKTFSNQLSYRSEVWLRLLGNFVAILILTEIWRAVLGNGEIEGVGVEQMITYSIINTLLAALLLTGISTKVDNSLKTGSIASELIKPLSYPLHLLSEGLGNSFYQLVFTSIPSLFIAWIFFGFLPPASATHFLFFLIALILALAISFLLGYLISLLAFWLMNHFALNWMLGGFITIFSGSFLPLWFFPESWVTITKMLPFLYLGYLPAAIYLGTIKVQEIGTFILTGLAWTAGLTLLVCWLWNRAIKRLVVQGG
ncbi:MULTISPECIES: ABC-2 family transporter protein [unclassified Paenibacillus]|uniref:ABC transporter permease n=1 Tax=unclassified Paenibacillus TaxID=185978 RepID=UPI0008C1931E|nr:MULTISPECIES: ABC-2 family transporter protein [unclassified Paenibacillus]QLG38992.1 ABC-2 family transporter protein [Paenibacillus sp. E222]SEP34324.1 ABC-2 type transport system permease protein [Paenibacillus sp. OK076]